MVIGGERSGGGWRRVAVKPSPGKLGERELGFENDENEVVSEEEKESGGCAF
ncbi:hypothetical protein Hanom_Chr12g01090921 [Helianthus anomalus]